MRFLLGIAMILSLGACDEEKSPLVKKAEDKKESPAKKTTDKNPESETKETEFIWDGLQNRENSVFSIRSVP